MIIKPKKCKGTGIAVDYGCGTETLVRTYGLGHFCKCYSNWLLNSDYGKQKLQNSIIIGKVKTENRLKQYSKTQDRNLREGVKNWKNELQAEINKIVRLIDSGLLCLARNNGGKMQAGHVFSRGGNSNIRYNLHNIHRQNAQSNHFQNDDGLLREGLSKEYGEGYMKFISELRRTPVIQLKDFEYRELTTIAKKIVLRLRKENRQYLIVQRIQLRNEINLELEIYKEEYCIFNI